MAPGWEMHGLNFTLGMQSMDYNITPAAMAAPMYTYNLPSADTLRIEDLLDFTNLELLPSSATNADAHFTPPPPPAAITSEHRSTAFPEDHFMPCEEAAELEWLSQFVEDSFSNNPYPPLPASTEKQQLPNYPSAASRGARSKREHHLMSAAWAASAAVQSTSSSTTSSSSSEFPSRASSASASSSRRKRGGEEGDGGARRCTHCASEKTPQWRTGPMGPKTLCNACGVRYKSGRLVPEYRPASSPTFVLTQHSNSHRKVMELRRQKEHHGIRHDGGAAAGELLYHDYEVC